jgi:cyclophilin family peptidyl-prolyl cis-trans isomerase
LAQARYEENIELGIPGTPFVLINSRIYDGPTDYDNLNLIIRLLALQERQYTTCPPVIIDLDRSYVATIETEKGNIVIDLLPQQAPLAVNNFVFLATNGWYDGVTFHRVLAGYIAQAGDPSGTGFGGPGYAFVNEDSELKFDSPGLVAMANSGQDTNGSQFFITFAPAPSLDGGYTIFGRVLEGLNVALSLSVRDPGQGVNLPPGDRIITITIQES